MTRRNVWLFVLAVVVGPLIGSVALMAGMTLYDLVFEGGGPGALDFFVAYWPFLLTVGYTLGCIPAAIFAVVMANLSGRIASHNGRLAVAALVGGVTSLVIVGFFAVGGFDGLTASIAILAAVAVTGALTGLVCMAIIERLHPLPKPTVASP